jgi:CHAT domain-containing protein
VAEVVYPAPVSLDLLRSRFPEETALVSYQLGAESAAAVVVTRDGATLVPLGRAAPIAEAVAGYLRIASTPDGPEERLAARLFEAVLAPVQERVGGARRLVIAPDGALAFLPFAALRSPGGERAVERWEITMVPSATVYETLLAAASSAAATRAVALGDPTYPASRAAPSGFASLARLPGSGEEARMVAALWGEERTALLLGDEASVPALRDALARPERLRVLHFACHAFVDPERPRLSGLVLAGGEILDADEIHRMRIPADLAVLSACETGRGALSRGEGPLGFVRGFLFAGVPRVVVSDWKVSDAAALRLMRRFYEGMIGSGLAPAAALRAAQLAALRSSSSDSHPYAWAPFVLWGLGP